ncbi:MAG: glycoside hydrolase family 5 protein [Myxococcota bacterium]|nr:glycoside hydrolase family 5 protein [Myxococcota bacterium]
MAPMASVAKLKPALHRGINLGDALDAPREGEWGVVLDASDFVSVKQAGFDHVRLPVRFSGHAASSTTYAIDGDFFSRVDWAIDQALSNGLAIIVDFHHYGEMMEAPDEHRGRFVAMWKQIAERYKGRPEGVAFELLNEPSGKLTADKWNDTLEETLHVVRASNPTRTIIVEGVFWASAHNLRFTLKVPSDDPNLVGSFHMYQPILFTHQGASFMPAEFHTQGVLFPGPPPQPIAPAASEVDWVRNWFKRYNELPADTNPSGEATIREELDLAQGFAERTHLPVYMGEFGAIDKADPKSREAWTRTTRGEAERRGFGWAYWDDGGSFKAYDRASRTWVPYLKSALLN